MTAVESLAPLLQLVPASAFDGQLDDWGPRVGADSGEPMMSGSIWYEAPDGSVQVGIWACTPGGWSITDRPDTETVRILAGRARLTDASGGAVELAAGDVLVLPKG